MTINRCNCFRLQSSAIRRVASQSSNSGCVGGVPSLPKSLVLAAKPRPKCCCHRRLASTRAVKGLSLRVIQLANAVRRPVDCSPTGGGVMCASAGSSKVRKPGCTRISFPGMRVTGAMGPASLTTNLISGSGLGFFDSSGFNAIRSFCHSALVSPLRRSGNLDCSRSNWREAISAICRS